MIIGINGEIGSGKDLVGNIIQYIYYLHSDLDIDRKLSYETFRKTDRVNNILVSSRVPTIIKYADKLKDIVCILLDCTREQLEDRVYKETELGEEWWYYQLDRYYEKAYIDSLDKSSTEYRSFADLVVYNDFYNIPAHRRFYYKLVKPTPRLLLQLIGTECGRNIIHPNVWVNSTMNSYKPKGISKEHWDKTKDIEYKNKLNYPNWVITDVRFPNESKSITDKGGINIRIERDSPCAVCGLTKSERRGEQCNEITCPNGQKKHESETALDNYEFNYVIDNNSTIEELIERVKEIILIEKII